MNYDSIALPISFRFYRVPIRWLISWRPNKEDEVFGNHIFFQAEVLGGLEELDPVAARLRFLRLSSSRTEDELVEQVLQFLNSVGSFIEEDYISTKSVEVSIPKRGSEEILSYPKLEISIGQIADCLEQLKDIMRSDSPIYYPLKVGLRYHKSRPEPFVWTASFWDAAMAITLVDRIKKARVRSCAECGALFSLHTKHAKKFCTWLCAHRAAARKSRLKKGIRSGQQRHLAGGR